MNAIVEQPLAVRVMYPESDGRPIAENTKQFEYIVTIKGGLEANFVDDPNVFVAGDLLWYPVQGRNKLRTAPDTMVIFGRPKGHRRSYLQWLEEGIPPKVTFEVLSPGNRAGKMLKKFRFYERFGVDEYYIYDPDDGTLEGWIRKDDQFTRIPIMEGWVSPALGVKFTLQNGALVLYGRDGKPFRGYVELVKEADAAESAKDEAVRDAKKARRDAEKAQRDADKAQRDADKAQIEKVTAEQQRMHAESEREVAARETVKANLKAEKLVAQLKALGVEPEA